MFQIISRPYTIAQKFVDNIGMYRLVSGSLGVLAALSIIFGFFGLLAYSGLSQIFSLVTALLVALISNWLIAAVMKIPANHESAVITALILFFLAIPEENIFAVWPLALAVFIAILSKYILVIKKQHFLNPAAFGAAAVSVMGLYTFSWWVSNPTLFIPLIVLGIMVVMKVRKWVPVFGLLLVGFIIYLAEAHSYGDVMSNAVKTFFLSWPTLFMAFFMLTEPFTLPARKEAQFMYGGLVGFLSNTTMFAGFISMTPELALILGNIIMLPSRLKQKLFLTLESKQVIANDTVEFVFKKPQKFTFIAGQYLEWMLPHTQSDNKGTRRYFTIASSPSEATVRASMKITDMPSTFKAALNTLDIGKTVIASQLAGDFLLPQTTETKIGLIAGGIGVTPFRSHVKYMMDSDKKHDTALYYCVNFANELAYGELWEQAKQNLSFAYIPVVAKEATVLGGETGFVSAEMLKRRTADYLERTWYISGPPGMVNAYKKLLKDMGVKRSNIKTDFFPGAV